MALERDQQLEAPINHDAAEITKDVEKEAEIKYGAGGIPAVHGAGEVHGGAVTASQLAYEEPDKREQELVKKVGALVDQQFGGEMKRAFAHYDRNHDGGVEKDELEELLADAKIGNGITRGMWAKGILDKLDASHDRKIQWPEFEAVFTAKA